MVNVIGYVRRSTNRQEESLDQQRNKLEAYAKANGWKLTQIFEDDAISGSNMDRPGLEAMMQHALRTEDVGAVLAWERNRLARPKDPIDGLMLERQLTKAGKRVVYVATGQEAGQSFASGLISYVEHYQNGDYLRKLSRDTMRGLVSRAQRGLWCGGAIPFGYDRLCISMDGTPRRIIRDMPDGTQIVMQPDTQTIIETIPVGPRYTKPDYELCTLVPSDPIRVRAIQKLFADYAAGVPMRVLRDELNATGLRTARGHIFMIQTLYPILESAAYCGRSVYNQRTVSKWHRHSAGQSIERQDEGLESRPEGDWIVKPDAWPALIDQDTFDRVQARRKRSHETHQQTRGHAVSNQYFLTPFMVCGICGGRLFGQSVTPAKGRRQRYYTCSTHHRGHHERCPKRFSLPAYIVEDHVIALIKQDLVMLKDDQQLKEYIAQEIARLSGNDSDARQQLQRRLAELDQQIAKLRDHLKALDVATAQALGIYDEAKTATEERQKVEEALQRLAKTLPELPQAEEIAARAGTELDRFENLFTSMTVDQQKELIALYVKTIKVDPNAKKIEISLYPSLFTQIVTGVGGHLCGHLW